MDFNVGYDLRRWAEGVKMCLVVWEADWLVFLDRCTLRLVSYEIHTRAESANLLDEPVHCRDMLFTLVWRIEAVVAVSVLVLVVLLPH